MQITVEVSESTLERLVKERVGELFSYDARYRSTPVREYVRGLVDEAAGAAVKTALESILPELKEYAIEAVRESTKNAMKNAACRGLKALKKLYSHFDPEKMTEDQRAWLERQIEKEAGTREE